MEELHNECNTELNSSDKGSEKNDENPTIFSVFKRNEVPTVPLDQGDLSVLANAGVTAYNAFSLESDFMKQVCSHSDQRSVKSNGCFDFQGTPDSECKMGASNDCTPNTDQRFQKEIMTCILTPSTSAVIKSKQDDCVSDSDSSVYSSELIEEDLSDGSVFEEPEFHVRKNRKCGRNRVRQKDSFAREGVKKLRDDAYDDDFAERINSIKAEEELLKKEGSFDDGFHELDSGLRIPNICWKNLYKYQRTGVKWLNELHEQCVGGILADEMGLGKTITIVCFLRALSYTQAITQGFSFRGLGSVLIICPTTLIYQWLAEFRKWFPQCRIAVLHSSGTFRGTDSALVKKISKPRRDGSVLITSYTTFTKRYKLLISADWHYVILDEGHKIRNPNAQMTVAVKDVRTPHRLLLSGSPLQNNLKELWSLVDFIYPGRLGSLQSFTEKFAIPITQGGYANANSVQVRTAYKCACVLRDAICPYLLRRMKKDVEMAIQLPSKTEQVLFCEITSFQRRLYKDYLSSRECGRILTGKMDAFVGLITLRKLCNHPDLVTGGPNKHGDYNLGIDEDMDFGAPCRSGKMMVLKALLELWHEQGQRVLIFSQSRQMLTVLEKFVVKEGYSYLRMDGATLASNRQPMVEKFNNTKEIFLFLLTTRVGGLGVNLTGANRVIIFDPDWNPSTDIQARERAWRIGQQRPVTIYRLLTSGTIEEKIYQRQIFKQFLANRILGDPKQRRFLKTNDLYELFTLGDAKAIKNSGTETGSIFYGTVEEISRANYFDKTEEMLKKIGKKEVKELDGGSDNEARKILDDVLSPKRIEELKKIAHRISRSLSKSLPCNSSAVVRTEMNEKNDKVLKNEVFSNDKKKNRKHLFDKRYEVPFLYKQTRYREVDQDNEETKSKNQNDYVLGMLLKNSRVHSAIRHDQIVSESTPDEQLIEDEANAVAERAAVSIRHSRRRQKDEPQLKKRRFGLKTAASFSSSNSFETDEKLCSPKLIFGGSALLRPRHSEDHMLAAIRKRKERLLDSEDGEAEQQEKEYSSWISASDVGTPEVHRFDELAEDIRTFLAFRDGKATTFEVLDKFKDKVSVQDSTAFRSILRKLATFYKETHTWHLKDEYV